MTSLVTKEAGANEPSEYPWEIPVDASQATSAYKGALVDRSENGDLVGGEKLGD